MNCIWSLSGKKLLHERLFPLLLSHWTIKNVFLFLHKHESTLDGSLYKYSIFLSGGEMLDVCNCYVREMLEKC